MAASHVLLRKSFIFIKVTISSLVFYFFPRNRGSFVGYIYALETLSEALPMYLWKRI